MAKRTYQAIDKTIDGLKLEEFDDAIIQLAQPFDSANVYEIGRYVIHNNSIYQKVFPPYRRNLISRPYVKQLEKGNEEIISGITFTINKDGGILVEGEAENTYEYIINQDIELTGNTTYYLSGCPESGSLSSYYLMVEVDGEEYVDVGDSCSFEVVNDTTANLSIKIIESTLMENKTFYPQLEVGNRTVYQQPNKLNEEWISYHWRLIKNL